MSSHTFGIFDLAIPGIAVIALVGWQLWSINRTIARDKAEAARKESDTPGHAVGEHGLDEG